jgi:hypothetical protein
VNVKFTKRTQTNKEVRRRRKKRKRTSQYRKGHNNLYLISGQWRQQENLPATCAHLVVLVPRTDRTGLLAPTLAVAIPSTSSSALTLPRPEDGRTGASAPIGTDAGLLRCLGPGRTYPPETFLLIFSLTPNTKDKYK